MALTRYARLSGQHESSGVGSSVSLRYSAVFSRITLGESQYDPWELAGLSRSPHGTNALNRILAAH